MRSNCHEEDEVHRTADRDQRGPAFNWNRKYGGLGTTELRKSKQLGEENSRAEEDRGGPDARQADAPKRAQKKV